MIAPSVADSRTTPSRTTLAEALALATDRLAEAGVEQPASDARLLVELALGIDRTQVLVDRHRRLTATEQQAIRDLTSSRATRRPVSRIVGRREFWSLEFELSPATLDPRPESETVVTTALSLSDRHDAPLRLLDLGTGTGCLLLALLSELPGAFGIGVDRSEEAAGTARQNAVRLGLSDRAAIVVGNWADALTGRFDLIVTNPPYIVTSEIEGLAPEVARHDPRLALDGGRDGLDGARAVIPAIARLLAPGGYAVLEIGQGQSDQVIRLLTNSRIDRPFGVIRVHRDLAGFVRCISCQKSVGPFGICR